MCCTNAAWIDRRSQSSTDNCVNYWSELDEDYNHSIVESLTYPSQNQSFSEQFESHMNATTDSFAFWLLSNAYASVFVFAAGVRPTQSTSHCPRWSRRARSLRSLTVNCPDNNASNFQNASIELLLVEGAETRAVPKAFSANPSPVVLAHSEARGHRFLLRGRRRSIERQISSQRTH